VELDLTYLWITHEIDIAKHVADRIAVMYLGRIVEIGPVDEVFEQPRHPYTQSLLASVPVADPTRRSEFRPLYGEVPSPVNPPSGCTFHTRCPYAELAVCAVETPLLRQFGPHHLASCHFAEEIPERARALATSREES
jgi:oligopeptide/dipeptide ABC transporter ATP-binding protein